MNLCIWGIIGCIGYGFMCGHDDLQGPIWTSTLICWLLFDYRLLVFCLFGFSFGHDDIQGLGYR